MPIRRDKRLINRRVRVSNQASPLFNRIGTIKGFRGDQSSGNPYVMVLIDGHHIETLSAKSLELVQ